MEIITNNTPVKWIMVFDLDNAYASMEQSLNPAYQNHALCVSGSNGGNIIARSALAKQAGIKMGQPRYQIEPLVRNGSVIIVSANWANYQVLSQRFMRIVQEFFKQTEIYSVDEIFAEVTLSLKEVRSLVEAVRARVRQWLGLSASVGVAFNKLTAKLAVEEAKKRKSHIFIIEHEQHLDVLLHATLVEDLWNIGSARAKRLGSIGIATAYQLKIANIGVIRSVLGVIGTRIQVELHGIIAMPLVTVRPPPKNIGTHRAFGRSLRTIAELQQPVIVYVSRLGEKLRAAHMVCKTLSVSLSTNPFKTELPQYHQGTVVKLEMPTDDTFHLVHAALYGFEQIWREGYYYHRAGVILRDLSSAEPEQGILFAPDWALSSYKELWKTIDAINRRYGTETIRLLGSGINRDWTSKSENRSPYYLTRWTEIPRVQVQ